MRYSHKFKLKFIDKFEFDIRDNFISKKTCVYNKEKLKFHIVPFLVP